MLALLLAGLVEVSVQSQTLPVNPKSETERLFKQANEHFAKREFDKTFPLLQQALAINEKAYGSNHVQVAKVLFIVGGIYREKGDFTNALSMLQRSLAILERNFGKQDTNLAETLVVLGLTCRAQGDAAQAIGYFERCLSVLDGQPRGHEAKVVSMLVALAGLHETKAPDKAIRLYERGLSLMEKLRGMDHPDVAEVVSRLAATYSAVGSFERAVPLLERGEEIYEKHFGADTNSITTLEKLGRYYERRGDYTKALSLYERCFALCQKLLDKNSDQTATSLVDVANMLTATAKYGQALTLYDQALKIRGAQDGGENLSVAEILNNVGVLHQTKGDLLKALNCYERSLAIREKSLGPNHHEVAKSLSRIGSAHHDLGQFEKALTYYRRALLLRETAIGREDREAADRDLANSLNNIAVVLQAQGGLGQAMRFYERSLALLENRFGRSHPDVASVQNNIGLLCQMNGDYVRASEAFGSSLRINERVFGTNHPSLAPCLNNLALLRRAQGAVSESAALLERSLGIVEAAFGEDHIGASGILQNLADLNAAKGAWAIARRQYERSLAISRAKSGPLHPDVAVTLNNMGLLFQMQGELGQALTAWKASLAVTETLGPDSNPEIANSLNNMAFVYLEQENYSESLPTLQKMAQSQRAYLAGELSSSSDKNAFRLLEKYLHRIDLVHTASASGTSAGLASAKLLGPEHLLLNKSLLEEIQITQAKLGHGANAAVRELHGQYQAAEFQLARLADSKQEPAQRDARRRELQAELSQLEAKLAERVGLVAQTVRERNLSLADIARSLPPQSALVDFVHYRRYDFTAKTNLWQEARYAAYVTFPPAAGTTNFAVERVDLGEAAPINAAVAELHQLFAERRIAPQRLEPVLQRLSALLHTPLARHLTNVAHLIVCPDGQLGRLPFELLPVDAKGRRLVEDKLITYVSSGREVARLAQPRAAVATTAPLVMGNPDFDFILPGSSRREEAPTAQSAIGNRKSEVDLSLLTSAATSRQRFLSRSFRDFKFTPLPDSEHEARKAAAMLGTNCVLRLGASAREADLKAVSSPRVLHLATHGFFLTDQEFKRTNGLAENFLLAGNLPSGGGFQTRQSFAPPGQDWENPLIRCGIALAGANRATGITNAQAEDGILTGLEAALLNLQGTELVILSACDSGSGDVKIGEGVMSLRRAFTIAGAETVLASHWKVNDAATSTLMTEFMRRWQAGTPRGQAWREAQLSLLRSKEFSNPYFWAAFTLTGQWR